MGDKIKRFIECYIPVTTCNLRCHYCYITQQRKFDDKWTYLKYTPKFIAHSAMSVERLGGICMMNICGGGETLIPKETIELTKEFLKEGHYVTIVTNGTLSKRFDELKELGQELLSRLFIKFSYQFLELKRTNQIETYFNNIIKMRDSGVSFSCEITPNDELIPHIDEAKEYCLKYLKALPHITIARIDTEPDIPILTKLPKNKFEEIWSSFNSKMLEFKLPVFGEKRCEYCYAGDWSFCVNLGTGNATQCYKGESLGNIFENTEKPINFKQVGTHCKEPHCYNAHSFLLWGVIPDFTSTTYADIRNRICDDGSTWLKPKMQQFMSTKLQESNQITVATKKQNILQKIFKHRNKNK